MQRINLTHISAIIAGLCLYSSALAEKGKELGDFSRVLDTACQRNDVASLVRLAASTKGKDLWHMAMGVGPGDDASLRMRALMVRENLLFDDGGLLRNEIVAGLEGSLSQPETELLNQLRVDPADTTQMLQLLSDSDLSVRWIGIYKTRFIAAFGTSLVQALRGIAANDDYVILADVPGTGSAFSGCAPRRKSRIHRAPADDGE